MSELSFTYREYMSNAAGLQSLVVTLSAFAASPWHQARYRLILQTKKSTLAGPRGGGLVVHAVTLRPKKK